MLLLLFKEVTKIASCFSSSKSSVIDSNIIIKIKNLNAQWKCWYNYASMIIHTWSSATHKHHVNILQNSFLRQIEKLQFRAAVDVCGFYLTLARPLVDKGPIASSADLHWRSWTPVLRHRLHLRFQWPRAVTLYDRMIFGTRSVPSSKIYIK